MIKTIFNQDYVKNFEESVTLIEKKILVSALSDLIEISTK